MARFSSLMGIGVRMPETTSSPCAFIRYSPKKACSPVAGLRVKPTPVPEVSPMLPKTMHCTLTAVPAKTNGNEAAKVGIAIAGTAVNVQCMVFGNMGDTSGTGVGFTRNPATGEHAFFGEYLMNAQGEDFVSGIRTPCPSVS